MRSPLYRPGSAGPSHLQAPPADMHDELLREVIREQDQRFIDFVNVLATPTAGTDAAAGGVTRQMIEESFELLPDAEHRRIQLESKLIQVPLPGPEEASDDRAPDRLGES